jgi:hypothetical protein
MGPQLLPATASDASGWQQTVMAFLAEKERRSGSHRTVEGYARMLWRSSAGSARNLSTRVRHRGSEVRLAAPP